MKILDKKLAYIIFIITIVTSIFCLLRPIDSDVYHYLIYGRDIAEVGIPYYNTHNIEPGLKIVLQEWLFDWVIYKIYNSFSWVGLAIYQLIIYFAITVLLCKLLARTIKDTFVLSLLLCAILFPIILLYSVRAQFISIVLLLLQTYFLETKHNKWIFPLLLLLEINLHGSFWVFHYILILPYFVPWIKKSIASIKPILITALYSLPIMLINPYGLDTILYPIRAYNSQLRDLGIQELYSFRIFSIPALYLALIFTFFVWHIKKFNNVELYLLLGTLLLATMHKRNLYFIVFGLVSIFNNTELVKNISENKWQNRIKNTIDEIFIGLLGKIMKIAAAVALIAIVLISCINVQEPFEYTNIVNFLNKRNVEEVFTTFNTGTRLEWENFKVYIDSCPEVFSIKINKKKDILAEYIEISKDPRNNLETLNNYKYICTDDKLLINTLSGKNNWKLVESDTKDKYSIKLFENVGEVNDG